MYYPAHLPGDTLSSKARQSLITSNWDLIPVAQTPRKANSTTQTPRQSIQNGKINKNLKKEFKNLRSRKCSENADKWHNKRRIHFVGWEVCLSV